MQMGCESIEWSFKQFVMRKITADGSTSSISKNLASTAVEEYAHEFLRAAVGAIPVNARSNVAVDSTGAPTLVVVDARLKCIIFSYVDDMFRLVSGAYSIANDVPIDGWNASTALTVLDFFFFIQILL